MTDAFAPAQGEPASVTAGDLWTWRRDDLAGPYPPGDHALAYRFLPVGAGGTAFDLAAAEDSDGYRVEMLPAATADVTPGRWQWIALLTRSADGARAEIGRGTLEVLPDPAAATASAKSVNRRILEALEATIEGRAGSDVLEYEIEGRSLKRTPLTDLHRLLARYRALVAAEEGAAPGGIRYRRVRFA